VLLALFCFACLAINWAVFLRGKGQSTAALVGAAT
jgi:hypothetical protein